MAKKNPNVIVVNARREEMEAERVVDKLLRNKAMTSLLLAEVHAQKIESGDPAVYTPIQRAKLAYANAIKAAAFIMAADQLERVNRTERHADWDSITNRTHALFDILKPFLEIKDE